MTSEVEERIHKALARHPLERIEQGYRLVHPQGAGVSILRLLPANVVRDELQVVSVAEIVAHLSDTELVVGFRIRLILGSPGTAIQPFDQDVWVVALHYDKRDVRQSLAQFRALREANDRSVSYIVSYDAVRADNKYGEPLDAALGLTHLHLVAGRSAQSTLSGGTDITTESLHAIGRREQAAG